ncbi:AI-2E family transporter [Saccharospirillum mangrovi]|uniref:AI-2E family transporter n=1 Tax=Saccharospirillum mangrovi TaxID=2161747 RepID=UPI001300BC9F|nr:AI-2E family transporter [Saccharospirillum mangrovi]
MPSRLRPDPSDAPMARSLLTVAAVIIILAGMRVAQPILVPCLLALFLAVVTAPAVRWLVNWKVPVSVAIGLVVALVFGALYVIGSLVATSADDFFQRLPEYEESLEDGLDYMRERLPWLAGDLRSSLQSLAPPDSFIGFAGRLFSGVGSILLALALTVFILIFMLNEAQSLPEKVRRALGDSFDMAFARRFSRSVQRYLVIKCLVSAITGLAVWALIKLMGVDYPILWGTFAFVMNFIPNIGSLIAAVPPMFLATVQLGLPGLLISGLGFGAINAVIGNLLEPRLMGRSLDLSTLVVFISLVFWGWLLGPVGALLAVPLTVVVKIGLEIYPKSRWLAVLLSQ